MSAQPFDPKMLDADTSQHVYMSPQLRDARIRGDYDTVTAAEQAQKRDLEPIMAAIKEKGDKAFMLVTDQTGQRVNLITSDNATMWVHVSEDEAVKKEMPVPLDPKTGKPIDVLVRPTITIGSYSKNGQTTSVSRSKLNVTLQNLTAVTLSTVIGIMVGKAIAERIAGRLFSQAVDAAVALADAEFERLAQQAGQEGLAEIVVEGAVRFPFWRPMLGGILGGTVVSAAVFVITIAVWDLFVKDYYIEVRIYNFDSDPWETRDWWHDNGVIAGGESWKTHVIEGATIYIPMPFGGQVIADRPVAGYVSYLFQNSNVLLEGVGVALSVGPTKHKDQGFCLGYDLRRFTDNLLALRDGQIGIKKFYDDWQNWAKAGTKSLSIDVNVAGQPSIKVKSVTDALNGGKDETYKYDIFIGAA